MKRFFFETILHPRAVSALHTGTGALLAIQFLLLFPDLPLLYGPDGLVDHALVASPHGLWIADIVDYLAHLTDVAADHALYLLAALYIVLNILLAIHRLPWPGILFLLLFHGTWHTANDAFSYGADYLGASALFYCLCTPLSQPTCRTPILRLLQLHLCIIYFFGGLGKAMGVTWWNGEAAWKAMNQPYHVAEAPSIIGWLGQFPALWTVGGVIVVVLELGYPLFIWVAHTRRYWLYATVAMHTGIALFLGLFHFSAVMILLNLVAFHYAYLDDTTQPVHPSDGEPSRPWWAAWKRQAAAVRDTREGGITY